MRRIRDAASATAAPPGMFQPRARNGFVVIFVLFWIVLFAFAAMRITLTGRAEMRIAANARNHAIAEAAADGAVSTAIFELLARAWPADGALHVLREAALVTRVRITDEAERIDPNVAPLALMQGLLQACGAAAPAAARLAAAIAEWRSLDLLQSVGNERAPHYAAAGLDYIPPHKRFVSTDELGLVLGMTPVLLACIEPHVSVHALSVPSLQGTSDPVVRQALRIAYPDDVALPPAGAGDAAVVRIAAETEAADGGRFRRIAVVRIAPATEDDTALYRILSWEQDRGAAAR